MLTEGRNLRWICPNKQQRSPSSPPSAKGADGQVRHRAWPARVAHGEPPDYAVPLLILPTQNCNTCLTWPFQNHANLKSWRCFTRFRKLLSEGHKYLKIDPWWMLYSLDIWCKWWTSSHVTCWFAYELLARFETCMSPFSPGCLNKHANWCVDV